jgi:hypothetical protein
MDVSNLQRGELVRAVRDIPGLSLIKRGTFGVVFEPADYMGEDEGPMVRWVTGEAFSVADDDVCFPSDFSD